MNDIVILWDLCCMKTCRMWISGMKLYVYMWNMITDDVSVYDNIDMRWCWCWWSYWDEMMLMLMIILIWDDVDVDDDIDMRWC